MRALAALPFVLAFSCAAFSVPAAAQDAPQGPALAFVQGLQDHLLDCPSANGYQPGGDLLSSDWVPYEGNDPVLAMRAAELNDPDKSGSGSDGLANVNIFTKTVHGLELIQVMSLRTTNGGDAGSEVSENLDAPHITGAGPTADVASKGAEARFLCVTIIPDLSFMPSGKLLGAVFGEEVDVGVANSPGTLRDGSWIWDNLSPTHLRTIARYTNEYKGQTDLPRDVFYPGFYMLSYRKFTDEFPDPDTRPYPADEVIALVQSTCTTLPQADDARTHFYGLDWYGMGESSHPGALGLRKLLTERANDFDADAPLFVDVIQQDEAGETLYASIVIAQKDGEPIRECSVIDFDDERTVAAEAIADASDLTITNFQPSDRPSDQPSQSGLLSGIEFSKTYKEGDAQ